MTEPAPEGGVATCPRVGHLADWLGASCARPVPVCFVCYGCVMG